LGPPKKQEKLRTRVERTTKMFRPTAFVVAALLLLLPLCSNTMAGAHPVFVVAGKISFLFEIENGTVVANLTFPQDSWCAFGVIRAHSIHLVLCIANTTAAGCIEYDGYDFQTDKDPHQRVKVVGRPIINANGTVTVEFEVPVAVFDVVAGTNATANISIGTLSNGEPQPPTNNTSTAFTIAIPAANNVTLPANETLAPNATLPNVTSAPLTRAPSSASTYVSLVPVIIALLSALVLPTF